MVDQQHGQFQSHYPEWKQTYDMPTILQEIYEANVDRWIPAVIDDGKRNVLGVLVDAIDYDARHRQGARRRPRRAARSPSPRSPCTA